MSAIIGTMSNKREFLRPSREAYRIASVAEQEVDARTVERAIRYGAVVVRTRSVREAIERAAAAAGVKLGDGT